MNVTSRSLPRLRAGRCSARQSSPCRRQLPQPAVPRGTGGRLHDAATMREKADAGGPGSCRRPGGAGVQGIGPLLWGFFFGSASARQHQAVPFYRGSYATGCARSGDHGATVLPLPAGDLTACGHPKRAFWCDASGVGAADRKSIARGCAFLSHVRGAGALRAPPGLLAPGPDGERDGVETAGGGG
jgi:hypothetical protein